MFRLDVVLFGTGLYIRKRAQCSNATNQRTIEYCVTRVTREKLTWYKNPSTHDMMRVEEFLVDATMKICKVVSHYLFQNKKMTTTCLRTSK